MTQARTPDGTDAFKVIAERLAAVKRPVDVIARQVGSDLPASHEFLLFAGALDLAINAYERYLAADLAAANARVVERVQAEFKPVEKGDIIDARTEAK